MIKVLWAVMCISRHLPSRLECQQRGLNWNTPFILDNLIGYRHPGDMLIKVLSWFCLERGRGRPSAHVTEIREWSNTASIRKTESIFKVSAGAAFRNPCSPDLPCLSGLLLTRRSRGILCAGSQHLAIKNEWNNASYSKMDGPRDYHTKLSKLEKKKIPHNIPLYMELRKWHTWTYKIHKTNSPT